MPKDAWLPRGFQVAPGTSAGQVIEEGEDWQIYATMRSEERLLLARGSVLDRWSKAGLLPDGALQYFSFGPARLGAITGGRDQALTFLGSSKSPRSLTEALSFGASLKRTRGALKSEPLHDSIYVERYSTLLPTYSLTPATGDDVVLGSYLTGGVQVSCRATRRLASMLSWLPTDQIARIVRTAGLEESSSLGDLESERQLTKETAAFSLPGRPALENFFREHVIDIVENASRYKVLGIESPSAIVLHGPPGSGKTFAVSRLVEYLGWPSYEIGSGTVGSPYIHETGRKIAELFTKAMDHAPSVVVIDEMEAYLSDREQGASSGMHRVEEVGEFLRVIPEATKKGVLIIGMTNRLEMIDSAILRRGRFDHVISVNMPTGEEIAALLDGLLSTVPTAPGTTTAPLIERLAGRPPSDVAFVVREAARLAVRAGKDHIDTEGLLQACALAPSRMREEAPHPRIGFV
jgi:cell division protease FtsH